MTPEQWQAMGYRRWPGSTMHELCLYQKRVWDTPGLDLDHPLGYLNFHEYTQPQGGTLFTVEADIDRVPSQIGCRRVTWLPAEITPGIVGMIEDDYRRLAGVEA